MITGRNIDAQNSLFLIIDIQKNLAAAMNKDVYHKVESNVRLLIATCKVLQVPVSLTEQYRKGLGPTVDPIVKDLGEQYKPLDKVIFSACGEPAFCNDFKPVERKYVFMAGIEAHVCVLQTALDMIANGFHVHIVRDAMCSRYKEDWKNSLDYMRDAGAVVTTTETVAFQLLQKAGTPEFKAISPLFKNKGSAFKDR
ncbi:MAG: isochorismatase family protein [Dehalococcoidia bacterium]